MSLDEDLVAVKIHYEGRLCSSGIQSNYVGGRSEEIFLDRERTCYIDLLEDLSELCGWPAGPLPTLKYKLPNEQIDENIGIVNCDKGLMAMFSMFSSCDIIEMYVIGDEDVPCDDALVEVSCRVEETAHKRGRCHKVESSNKREKNISGGNNAQGTTIGFGGDEQGSDGHLSDYNDPSGYETFKSNSDVSDEEVEGGTFEDAFMINCEKPELNVNQLFKDVNSFRLALAHYAISEGFDVEFIKNERYRVTAKCKPEECKCKPEECKCKGEECKWRIHASLMQDDITFQVKTYKDEHTCMSNNAKGNHMASSMWISKYIKEQVRLDPNFSVTTAQNLMFTKFGVHVPYHRVWHGKEKAVEKVRGSFEDSYKLVPSFCMALLQDNPGSIIKHKMENNSFLRCFICFHASIRGFLIGCRPFIGLDGCHLKGKYKCCLLMATALDGNQGLFPLAYAVAEQENEDSWTWFLSHLQLAIGIPNHLVLMSDRQKGLINAVEKIFPSAWHRFCLRHMYKNFKRSFKGVVYENEVWRAGRAFTIHEFEASMEKIKGMSEDAYKWFDEVKPENWSRSHFDTYSKCDSLTNNLSESVNNEISRSRYMPIVEVLDIIRVKIMEKMAKRRQKAEEWESIVVPKVLKDLKSLTKEVNTCIVTHASDIEFEVVCPEGRYKVILESRTCTCRRWQVTGLPCKHAVACILRQRLNLESCCSSYYTVASYKNVYKEVIHALPDKNFWPSTEIVCNPPRSRRPPGRPKKKRVRGEDEPKGSQSRSSQKTTRCSSCKKLGHNRRSCKEPLTG